MLDRIELCDKHTLLVKCPNRVLRFVRGYNCVTGPIGSGKTVLLAAIRSCKDCAVVSSGLRGKIYYYSTERHDIRLFPLPRVSQVPSKEAAAGVVKEKNDKGMMLKTLSHGEGNVMLFGASLKALALKAGDTLLVDEPEAGLDLTYACEVAGAFNYLCGKKIQVIVTTHHPAFVSSLISHSDQVLMLGDSPKEDMEAYLTEWEEAIEALRECLNDGEDDGKDDEAVVTKVSDVDAACTSRP